ncbi:uncharacterized protein N7479_008365 [Penicillium vulpinum]|uniref:uncharacterized protein n=1 Tax=Penicillium vulpinum TaxID=29845 RepID=UPI00254676CE|nr:uncharacterized protein N7479_008365 [Penicillium vulpinum]KAJ5961215.1 hypothetical protein N7479_008365 [Penicillium vulpinum]
MDMAGLKYTTPSTGRRTATVGLSESHLTSINKIGSRRDRLRELSETYTPNPRIGTIDAGPTDQRVTTEPVEPIVQSIQHNRTNESEEEPL